MNSCSVHNCYRGWTLTCDLTSGLPWTLTSSQTLLHGPNVISVFEPLSCPDVFEKIHMIFSSWVALKIELHFTKFTRFRFFRREKNSWFYSCELFTRSQNSFHQIHMIFISIGFLFAVSLSPRPFKSLKNCSLHFTSSSSNYDPAEICVSPKPIVSITKLLTESHESLIQLWCNKAHEPWFAVGFGTLLQSCSCGNPTLISIRQNLQP